MNILIMDGGCYTAHSRTKGLFTLVARWAEHLEKLEGREGKMKKTILVDVHQADEVVAVMGGKGGKERVSLEAAYRKLTGQFYEAVRTRAGVKNFKGNYIRTYGRPLGHNPGSWYHRAGVLQKKIDVRIATEMAVYALAPTPVTIHLLTASPLDPALLTLLEKSPHVTLKYLTATLDPSPPLTTAHPTQLNTRFLLPNPRSFTEKLTLYRPRLGVADAKRYQDQLRWKVNTSLAKLVETDHKKGGGEKNEIM